MVAALAHGSGVVLGQVAVDEKSNEIPAARELLQLLDLDGVVVTMDAMHTQHDTAALVTGAGGDYVLTVKANQKSIRTAQGPSPGLRYPPSPGGTGDTDAVPPGRSRPLTYRHGSSSAEPCRSPSCGAPSPGRADGPSRSST
ncbi:ISAs1 family transposase [Streptomyces goshikiensis]|uniref:ISAs1 family transposase n=1 Tax=Streptomyces goshikiensis TaxID=1942 RepID=UPI00368F388F